MLGNKLMMCGQTKPVVFNQFIYTGTGATKTITTDLDLVNNRGIVVLKNRANYHWHCTDTQNGVNHQLRLDAPSNYDDYTNVVTAFGTTGFTLGDSSTTNGSGSNIVGFSIQTNTSGSNKIFRVRRITGDGSSSRVVAHHLGVTPTMIWVKADHDDRNWPVYHKYLHETSPEDYKLYLSDDAARSTTASWDNTAPDSTNITLGDSSLVNENGRQITIFTFADYPGVFKTGAYTGNGTSQNIDMGFAEGASMFVSKAISSSSGWHMWCKAVGIGSGNESYIDIDKESSDNTGHDYVDYYAAGITVKGNSAGNYNGADYIYFAFA